MPAPSAELFFPSRQSQRLAKNSVVILLDVEEATGAPRLTAADVFGPESRNGLLCGGDPVNYTDPYGLTPGVVVEGDPVYQNEDKGGGPSFGSRSSGTPLGGAGDVPGGAGEGFFQGYINPETGGYVDTLPGPPNIVRAPPIGTPFSPPGVFPPGYAPAPSAGGPAGVPAGTGEPTLGDLYDHDRLRQQLVQYGTQNQAALNSTAQFGQALYIGASVYSAIGVGAIGAGEVIGSIGLQTYWRGGEVVFARYHGMPGYLDRVRIAFFGNGPKPGQVNPYYRRLPHYHRRGGGEFGEHRPWEKGRF